MRKTAEAKAIYSRLASDNPKSWEVEQALAYLAWRGSENESAKKHFRRAMELGGNDGQAYFDYAKLLQGGYDNDVLLKQVLTKAVELRPDLTDAKMLLAFHCYNTQDYRGAITHLSGIKKVAPERAVSFFQVYGYTLFRMGNSEDALKQAERARQYSKTPEEIQRSEELLKFISGYKPSPTVAAVENPLTAQLPTRIAGEALHKAEGTLLAVECLGEKAKIHILSDGKKRAFLIVDPSKVQMKKSAILDIICGDQKGEAVVVEYIVNTDTSLNAEGIVRILEIKSK
jgi:tetratricopeptide (TPR) repeat protein